MINRFLGRKRTLFCPYPEHILACFLPDVQYITILQLIQNRQYFELSLSPTVIEKLELNPEHELVDYAVLGLDGSLSCTIGDLLGKMLLIPDATQ